MTASRAWGRPGGQVGAGDRERRVERRDGQVGEPGHDRVQRVGPGEVPGRLLQQTSPVGKAQLRRRIGAGHRPVRDRPGRHRVRAHRRQQIGPQLAGGEGRERRIRSQQSPVRRMTHEVIAESRAGAEHSRQPVAQPGIVGERGEQLRSWPHPGQRGQREVGIRRAGERLQQALADVAEPAEPAEQRLGARGVREAHRRQLAGQTAAGHAHHSTVATTARAGAAGPAGYSIGSTG